MFGLQLNCPTDGQQIPTPEGQGKQSRRRVAAISGEGRETNDQWERTATLGSKLYY
jgi:hypothetical protein